MNFVVRLQDGKLKSSNVAGQFDRDLTGCELLAKAIIAAAKMGDGEVMMMRSSTLDFPEESGGEEGVDYGEFVVHFLQREINATVEYPYSLANDTTKVGKQATLVHSADNELYLSMNNGILTLHRNGTWSWMDRIGSETMVVPEKEEPLTVAQKEMIEECSDR